MAKKSNKTEHVLKLITQEEHEQEEIIEEENPEQGPQEVAQDELEHYHEHRLLINLAEIMVKENLEAVMDRMNICECDISLNSLPTRYVTTDKGKQLIQLETYKKQYEVDVMAALTKACVKVKVVPRH